MAIQHKHMSKNPNLGRFKLDSLVVKIIVVVIVVLFILSQNHFVLCNQYTYQNSNLPKSFNGYKIMHVSDIVNYGNSAVGIAKRMKPDIIVVTGNYCDKHGKSQKSVNQINKLADIAPTYYVYNPEDNGNELSETKAQCLVEKDKNGYIYIDSKYKAEDFENYIKYNYGDNLWKKAQAEKDNGGNNLNQLNQIETEFKQTLNNQIVFYGYQTYNDFWTAEEENAQTDKTREAKGYINETTHSIVESDTYDFSGENYEKFKIAVNGNIKNLDIVAPLRSFDMILSGGIVEQNGFDVALANIFTPMLSIFDPNINLSGIIKDFTGYWPGINEVNGTDVFVSSGLGTKNHIRMMNWPEVTIITLSDGTTVQDNFFTKWLKSLPFIGDVKDRFANDGGIKKVNYTYEHTDGTHESYTIQQHNVEEEDE